MIEGADDPVTWLFCPGCGVASVVEVRRHGFCESEGCDVVCWNMTTGWSMRKAQPELVHLIIDDRARRDG